MGRMNVRTTNGKIIVPGKNEVPWGALNRDQKLLALLKRSEEQAREIAHMREGLRNLSYLANWQAGVIRALEKRGLIDRAELDREVFAERAASAEALGGERPPAVEDLPLSVLLLGGPKVHEAAVRAGQAEGSEEGDVAQGGEA